MAQEGKTRWQRIQAVSRKNRYQNSLFICLLALAFALVFVVLTLLSPASPGQKEPAPGLSVRTLLDGSWSDGVEEGFRDRFAGKDRWLRTGLVMSRVVGAEENGGVYLGADGYLFRKTADRELSSGRRFVEVVRDFAADHPELRTVLLPLPGAWTVLSDRLPEGAVVPNQADQLAMLQQAAGELPIPDVTEALKAHGDEGLYYRTDEHMTALGARYALEASAEALGLQPAEYVCRTVTDRFSGPLAAQSGNVDATDLIRICVPQDEVAYKVVDPETGAVSTTLFSAEALDSEEPLNVFLGGGRPGTRVVTTADTGRRLLLIGDDWARCFLPLLVPYFEEILFLEPDCGFLETDAPIRAEDFTDLLILCSLDHLLTDPRPAVLLVDGSVE